jgi:hypothetical protein
MRKYLFLSILAAFSILLVMIMVPVRQEAHAQEAHAHEAHARNDGAHKDFITPTVFQAAGPTISSIQGSVDQFRAALGATNNGNAPGPLPNGRREINWDGGGATDTAIAGTPFDGFLVTRGARFETPGSGFVQAPLDGLVTTFGNPTYSDIFQTFSPLRLFSAIESNVTDGLFFVPGGANIPATITGFGAIFTDVDSPDGSAGKGHGNSKASTLILYYDSHDNLIFKGFVPSSPGDRSLSFFGAVFNDARIAKVRIISGDVAPGPNDGRKDIVMMDDFIFGEPQAIH